MALFQIALLVGLIGDDAIKTREHALNAGKLATCYGIVGTLSICGHLAHVLFDSGLTHSFVAPYFASKLASNPELLGYILFVSFPSGNSVLGTDVYKSCAISLKGETLYVDLISLHIGNFDVILGMDWLVANYAFIDCKAKKASSSY